MSGDNDKTRRQAAIALPQSFAAAPLAKGCQQYYNNDTACNTIIGTPLCHSCTPSTKRQTRYFLATSRANMMSVEPYAARMAWCSITGQLAGWWLVDRSPPCLVRQKVLRLSKFLAFSKGILRSRTKRQTRYFLATSRANMLRRTLCGSYGLVFDHGAAGQVVAG
ncbi:hypothetical protein ACJJTC_016266 [Scirpophaga incertulas]